jgi:hypothetical protein
MPDGVVIRYIPEAQDDLPVIDLFDGSEHILRDGEWVVKFLPWHCNHRIDEGYRVFDGDMFKHVFTNLDVSMAETDKLIEEDHARDLAKRKLVVKSLRDFADALDAHPNHPMLCEHIADTTGIFHTVKVVVQTEPLGG